MGRHGEFIRLPGGGGAFVDYGHARKRVRCSYCSKEGTKLCDGPGRDGRKTCDRPLCAEHARQGPKPGTDLCPHCAGERERR